jgi:RNA polymerase sigma factor (sigma-70 family)
MVAMLLGTALSTFSAAPAAAQAPEGAREAIDDMGRYCTTCWRNARLPVDSWCDCTQEVFRRLLERVPPESWGLALRAEGEERREFLRAIDTVKKRTQRARKFSPGVEMVPDQHEARAARLRDERETVSQAAAELLTPRQQRILQMSFEGWSVQDMGHELDLPAQRISDEKYKAIHKLRAYLGTDNPDTRSVAQLPA